MNELILCLILLLNAITFIAWKNYIDLKVIKQYNNELKINNELRIKNDRELKNTNTKKNKNLRHHAKQNNHVQRFCSKLSGHCEVYPWWRVNTHKF